MTKFTPLCLALLVLLPPVCQSFTTIQSAQKLQRRGTAPRTLFNVNPEVADTSTASPSAVPRKRKNNGKDGSLFFATAITKVENDLNISASGDSSTTLESSRLSSPIRLWLKENLFLGIDPTPEIVAIVTIYFVQGALGLARLAQSFLLKDELSLGPAELSALTGIFVLPWTIKPVYGFLSDGFPLFGYQRKSYLVLAGLFGALSYGFLSVGGIWESLETSVKIGGTVTALLLSSACVAISDVVADGMVVTQTRQLSKNDNSVAGGLQSLCWGAASIGGLLSAYFSGSLLEIMPARSIFGITAVLPLFVALIALTINEKKIIVEKGEESQNQIVENVKGQVSALWEAFRQPSIWRPALFLFLWRSTPTSDGAFFFFLTNDLQLGPEFLGKVRLVSTGATLFGVFLYNSYLKNVKIKDILFWSTIASFPLGLVPILLITHVNRELGIPDQALIYGDDVVLAALGEIAFLPTLVLAARLCPPGIEAVLFATLMSINNGASTVGTEIGALLTKLAGITETNFDNLAWLTVFCNVTSLWPLLLIGWLDGVGGVSEAELEKEEKSGVIDMKASAQRDDITSSYKDATSLK